MLIQVDDTSAVPAFEQVRAQLEQLITSGELPAGHKLPPIRHLAADLGLAPGTVARVYRELEASGLVSSKVRHGTIVQPRQQLPAAEVHAQLDEAARGFALLAQRLGVPLDSAMDAVRAGWQA